MTKDNKNLEPAQIFSEYKNGVEFKDTIGDKGLHQQAKINERFFVGDQWYGAKCGNDKPLARRNTIKRIGEYKLSSIGAAPIAVNYSADGVPNTNDINYDNNGEARLREFAEIEPTEPTADADEITVIMSALSAYQKVTAERLKFNSLSYQALRNAYTSGTGILYTYWDDRIETGLYADEERTTKITGDISCQVLDIENVCFGDANNPSIEEQPYIIISQRRHIDDVKREARRSGISSLELDLIKPDSYDGYNAGDRGENEPKDSQRVTVLTKFYKEWDEEGKSYKVMAVKVTEKAYVRKPWTLKLKLYPFAKLCWDTRRSSAYGESEVTYMIPNQIAINRALTASIWATMAIGMPTKIVNGDVVPSNVTNDPGQILRVYGTSEDVAGAIHYVTPPNFTAAIQNFVNNLAENSLNDGGAYDAALGNIRPDNASAIIQIREAALQPLQIYQNRYYDFIEDVARIWADFWVNYYGDRSIKMSDKSGIWYLPFKAERYKDLVITANIDVGAASLYSSSLVISALGNLLQMGVITPLEYFERLPQGIIPDITGLINSRLNEQMAMPTEGDITDEEIIAQLKATQPQLYEQLMTMPEEQRAMLLSKIRGQGAEPTTEAPVEETPYIDETEEGDD